jgi:hypothetical protein
VRPSHSRRYGEALQNLEVPEALDLLVNAVIADNARQAMRGEVTLDEANQAGVPAYLQLMEVIESQLDS